MQANPEDVRFLNSGATDLGFNFGESLFNRLGDYTSTKNPKGGPQDVTNNKDQLMLSWDILQQQSVEKRQEIVRSIILGANNPLFKIMPLQLTDKGIFKQEFLHFSGDGFIERTAPGTLIRNITTKRDTKTGYMHYTALGFLTNYYAFKGPDAGRQAALLYAENMKRVVAAIWNAVLLDTSNAMMRIPSYYSNPEQVWGGMKIPDTPEEYLEIQSTRYLILNREAQSLGKLVSHADAVLQQAGGRAEYMMIDPKGLSLIKFRDETNLRREYSGNRAIANRQDVKALTNTESVSYGGITGIMLPRMENKLHQDISEFVTKFRTAIGSHFGHVPCFTDVPPAEYKSWMSYIRTASWETNDFDEYTPYFGMRHCPQFIPMNENVSIFGEKGNSTKEGMLNAEWLDEMVKNIADKVHTVSNAKYEMSPDISLTWDETEKKYKPITCIGELDDRTPDSYFEYMRLVFAQRLKDYKLEQILPRHPLVSMGGEMSGEWEKVTVTVQVNVRSEIEKEVYVSYTQRNSDAILLIPGEILDGNGAKKAADFEKEYKEGDSRRAIKNVIGNQTAWDFFASFVDLIRNNVSTYIEKIKATDTDAITSVIVTGEDDDNMLVYKACSRYSGTYTASEIISEIQGVSEKASSFLDLLNTVKDDVYFRGLLNGTNALKDKDKEPASITSALKKVIGGIKDKSIPDRYQMALKLFDDIVKRFPMTKEKQTFGVTSPVTQYVDILRNKATRTIKFANNDDKNKYEIVNAPLEMNTFQDDENRKQALLYFLDQLNFSTLNRTAASIVRTDDNVNFHVQIDKFGNLYDKGRTFAGIADDILSQLNGFLASYDIGDKERAEKFLKQLQPTFFTDFENFVREESINVNSEFDQDFVKKYGTSYDLVNRLSSLFLKKGASKMTIGQVFNSVLETMKTATKFLQFSKRVQVTEYRIVEKGKSASTGETTGMYQGGRATMSSKKGPQGYGMGNVSFSSKRADSSKSNLPAYADGKNSHFVRRLQHYIDRFGENSGTEFNSAVLLLLCPFDLHTMRAFDKFDIPPFAFPHYLRPWETRYTSVIPWASDQQLGVTHIDKAGIDRITHYDPVTGVFQDNYSLAHQAQVMNNAGFFITPMAYGGEELGGCGKHAVNEGLSYNQSPEEWAKMVEKLGDGSKLGNRSIICTLMSYEEALHAPKWLDIRGRFHQGDFPYIHPSYQFTPVNQQVPPMYGGQFVTMEAFEIKNHETMMLDPNNMTMNNIAGNYAHNNICGQAYTLMYSHRARTKQQAMQAHHLVGKRLPGCADLESGNGPIYNGFSGGKLQYLYKPQSALKQEEMNQVRT